MTQYLLKQIIISVVKLFIFLTFMFFFIQVMMPGDWVDQFSLSCDAECREAMRIQLGLNLPVWQRYLQWLKQVVMLDLGHSMTGEPIVDIMKQVIPLTMLVFLTGTVIAFMLGFWMGKRTGWKPHSLVSSFLTFGGITLFTSFPPWLVWLVTYALAGGVGFYVMGEVGGLRGTRFRGLDTTTWLNVEVTPYTVAYYMVLTLIASMVIVFIIKFIIERLTRFRIPGILLVLLIAGGTVGSWYYLEIEPLAFDLLKISWIAILTYILLTFGETMLIMQSSMREVMKEEYINAARAKGLSAKTVREKHAARNALLPTLSRLVISLPAMVAGIAIIESSVGWPGMGTSMWNALYWQNMPIVMNTLLFMGVLALIARLILDILTAYVDPRIRYSTDSISLTS